MTKDEAKFKIVEMYFKNTEYYGQDFEVFVEGIYDDFEQQLSDMQKRIDELEAPKNCEGCEYYTLRKERYLSPCSVCSRFYNDRYEPKDKQ